MNAPVRSARALAAPSVTAAGALVLLAGGPQTIGRALVLAGALMLLALDLAALRRSASIAVDLRVMGAFALAGGGLLWLAGGRTSDAVPLWLLFPVLSVVGQRLDRPRSEPADDVPARTARALAAAAVLGACLLSATGAAHLVVGPALAGLAVVMAGHDDARRMIRAGGGYRLAAACVLAGYMWLGTAGIIWAIAPIADSAGPLHPAYDAVIACLSVGLACPVIMVLARAAPPLMIRRRPYHRLMWVPPVLLHAGGAVGVAGLMSGRAGPWPGGGVFGAVAIGAPAVLAPLLMAALASAGAGRGDGAGRRGQVRP